MDNKDDKLDKLFQKLRETTPELTNSGWLTDRIMLKVKDKSKNRKPIVLICIRSITSTAAILLLGLFLFQQNVTETTDSVTKQTGYSEIRINFDSECLKNIKNPTSNLMALYLCHLQQNSIKNKQFKIVDQQLKN